MKIILSYCEKNKGLDIRNLLWSTLKMAVIFWLSIVSFACDTVKISDRESASETESMLYRYSPPVFSQNFGRVDYFFMSPDFDVTIGASEYGIFIFDSMKASAPQSILSNNPNHVTISPHKNTIAWISGDTDISILELNEYKHAPITILSENPVTSIVFSASGDRLAFSTYARELSIYNLLDKKFVSKWEAPEWLTNITYSPDGASIAGASLSSSQIVVFDVKTGEVKRIYSWRDSVYSSLYGAYISPSWRKIAWVSKNAIQIMDMENDKLGPLLNHKDFISEFAWSPDGQLVASSSLAEISGELIPYVYIWDVERGIKIKELFQEALVQNLFFSIDASQIAVFNTNGNLNIWNIED
jgi:WD40 repeat protein